MVVNYLQGIQRIIFSELRYKLLILLVFLTILCHAQPKIDPIKSYKSVAIGYGPVLSGKIDVFGHKMFVSSSYNFAKKSKICYILSGTLIEMGFDFLDNPDWHIYQVSNGLDFSTQYQYEFRAKHFFVQPSIGPAIRYSHEKHTNNYWISLNKNTGDYDWFMDENDNVGLRLGYDLSINIEIPLSDFFSVGSKIAFSHYILNGYIFSSVGVSLIYKRLRTNLIYK